MVIGVLVVLWIMVREEAQCCRQLLLSVQLPLKNKAASAHMINLVSSAAFPDQHCSIGPHRRLLRNGDVQEREQS